MELASALRACHAEGRRGAPWGFQVLVVSSCHLSTESLAGRSRAGATGAQPPNPAPGVTSRYEPNYESRKALIRTAKRTKKRTRPSVRKRSTQRNRVSAEQLATSVSARSTVQNRRGAGDQNRRTVGFALAKSAAPEPGIHKTKRGDSLTKLRRTMLTATASKNRGLTLLALDAEKWHAPCLCWRNATMQHGHRAEDCPTLRNAKVAGRTPKQEKLLPRVRSRQAPRTRAG